MAYGICNTTQIPLRSTPSEKAEMVTQLLFGETYSVLDHKNNWMLIQMHYDSYEGWIDKKQYHPISENAIKLLINKPVSVSIDPISMIKVKESTELPITFGSNLLIAEGKEIQSADSSGFFNGNKNVINLPQPEKIGQYAMQFLHVSYLWGGRTFFGIDCSGFTQIVFKAAGIRLYRDASQQATQGHAIDFVEEAQAGDLAFFDNEEGRIIHTGILLGNGKIIHASGHVRLDNVDHQGIFNADIQQYTHKLRLLKRMG
jgi:gamma-D-glutamyl-L-lysine dipeptidyl-peptidase